GCYQLTVRFRFVSTHFDSSSPLHTTPRLLALRRLLHAQESPKFSPPPVTRVHGLRVHHYYGLICHPQRFT
ncbi:MAG TPA: hypothetical protein VJ064_08815, partial [Limnochordia bacterium]|nr:hypothetical protein [Limnochordia bacterium]